MASSFTRSLDHT